MTTAYTASNPVPLGASPTSSGITQKFLASVTNPSNATFAPDGYAAAPIYGLGGQALQGNEIVANGVATLVSYVGPLMNSGALCWVLLDCNGGAQQVATATQSLHAVTLAQMNAVTTSGIRGLTGTANATTPLTKFDFSSISRTFRNAATGAIFTTYSTATITVDAGLAGPALNGRDQAAAFTAGSWIYLYALSNGAGTEGGILSANPPSTGPNALTGYPNSVFVTALYWTSASAIRRVVAKGNFVYEAALLSVASNGNSSGSEVTISLASACPPIASRIKTWILSYLSTNANGGGTASANYRFISGLDAIAIPLGVPLPNDTAYYNDEVEFPNVAQSLIYVGTLTSGVNNLSAIASNISSIGYAVPNGDS